MKAIDQYHRWVEWSEEDAVYVGRCPDLITGIHGHDAVDVYRELEQVVAEVIDELQRNGKPLPTPRTRPMQEV
ncbi:MAG: pilus assembly protein HicB [Planctomycetota bacterium]